MSDALIFATLFATYGVLSTSYAGGPTPRQIFELPLVAVNTAMLLFSSITYGMAMIETEAGRAPRHARRGWRSPRCSASPLSPSSCTSSPA